MRLFFVLLLLAISACNDAKLGVVNGSMNTAIVERNDLPDIKDTFLASKAGKSFTGSCYTFAGTSPQLYGKYMVDFSGDVENDRQIYYYLVIYSDSGCTVRVDEVYHEYEITKVSQRNNTEGYYDLELKVLAVYDAIDFADGLPYSSYMRAIDPFHNRYRNIGDIDHQVLVFTIPSPTTRMVESISIPHAFNSSGDTYLTRRNEQSDVRTILITTPVFIPIGL